MGLENELEALRQLYEKGQLSDQAYANAKATVIKSQTTADAEAGELVGSGQEQGRNSPGCLTIFVGTIGAVVILLIIISSLPHSGNKTNSESSSESSYGISHDPVQRPAVLVSLAAWPTGNEDEDLGARDYADAAAKKNLPGVVIGLNAICSEFHFYSEVSNPDYRLAYVVKDIDQIGLGIYDAHDKKIGVKIATNIDSAYFEACGILRRHVAGSTKH